jgi:FixJ family two-component response regulator
MDLLEAVDATEFDCVVADIYLPRMNGLQLQEELSRAVPYTSIVFIAGHGDLSLGTQAMRKGTRGVKDNRPRRIVNQRSR